MKIGSSKGHTRTCVCLESAKNSPHASKGWRFYYTRRNNSIICTRKVKTKGQYGPKGTHKKDQVKFLQVNIFDIQ